MTAWILTLRDAEMYLADAGALRPGFKLVTDPTEAITFATEHGALNYTLRLRKLNPLSAELVDRLEPVEVTLDEGAGAWDTVRRILKRAITGRARECIR